MYFIIQFLYLNIPRLLPESLLEVPAQDEDVPVLDVQHHLVARPAALACSKVGQTDLNSQQLFN